MNVHHLIKQRLQQQHHAILAHSQRPISGWFDKEKRKFFDPKLSDKEEPRFFSETEPNPLQDIENRIETSKEKLKWRSPITQRSTFVTEGLRLLAPERTKQFFEVIQRPMDMNSLKESLYLKKLQVMAFDQRFIPDRHRILGNDLAAAHFLVARGGQVRYVNKSNVKLNESLSQSQSMSSIFRFTRSPEWVKRDKNDEYDLPRLYDGKYLIDAIKCDGMDLYYEGLENVRRLNHLKYMSLRDVKTFDDWCMDRLCGNQYGEIEILDVTGTCITANALIAVPKLRSLKALVLDTEDRSIEFQLACALLQEVMPHLKILSSSDVHDDIYEAKKLKNAEKQTEKLTEIKD